MGLWIEMHCDAKLDRSTKYGEPACWSNRNDGFGILVYNTNAAALGGIRHLRKTSKHNGWVKSGNSWICPSCVKTRDEEPKP